jgi:hypothetical protein
MDILISDAEHVISDLQMYVIGFFKFFKDVYSSVFFMEIISLCVKCAGITSLCDCNVSTIFF